MKAPFFWIDAFAERVFAGNPAAVVPLSSFPEDALLQRIAWQNGLAETAFFVPTGPGRYHLRWFTPEIEMDLCGHATLASAWVLYHELGYAEPSVTFDSRSGPLIVRRRADGLLELDFPSRPAVAVERAAYPATLVKGLGLEPEWVGKARDYLCVFPTAAEVVGLTPDFAALNEIDVVGIIATAPGEGCDFVSRFFAPRCAVPEDPVTGSAHCTLVPYWAERLGKRDFVARQVSVRGGTLYCTLVDDRVRMAGPAVTYIRGELSL